jgi:MFS family permease
MIFRDPSPIAGQSGGDSAVDRAVFKAGRRLLPFVFLLYVIAFLDRVNIGYVKQSFLSDTGLSEQAFAMGAGIFFVGYALLEIPSNLMMFRIGARVWIGRIMITWGLVAAAMMFAWTSTSFYTLRFLLGVMEAGFFPGIILYLACWFPAKNRGAMMGLFYFGAPCAQIFGGPFSGLLLDMEGVGGLKGWQWVFLAEGLIAVAVGIWTFWRLTNRPSEASWLLEKERSELQAAMDAEDREKRRGDSKGAFALLGQWRVWQLGIIYGLIQISVYGVTFYLPSQVAGLMAMKAGIAVGFVSAIPWVCALLAAYVMPRLAARPSRTAIVASLSLALAAAGIYIASTSNPIVGLAALCVAAAGFIGVQPVFWTFPMGEFAGAQAACGIALINSMGSIGGGLASNFRVAAVREWGSPSAGSTALAVVTLLAAVLIFFAARRPRVAPARV